MRKLEISLFIASVLVIFYQRIKIANFELISQSRNESEISPSYSTSAITLALDAPTIKIGSILTQFTVNCINIHDGGTCILFNFLGNDPHMAICVPVCRGQFYLTSSHCLLGRHFWIINRWNPVYGLKNREDENYARHF